MNRFGDQALLHLGAIDRTLRAVSIRGLIFDQHASQKRFPAGDAVN